MQIQTILDQIDLGAMALPEFQRGYVWNREQVRRFMHSLYRRFPVGSLLVWITKTARVPRRGDSVLQPGTVKLILDGQQRLTSLYGIMRGTPPKFFEGSPSAFTGLYFNLEDETFEFYSPLKMRDNPLWINVTELMHKGQGTYIGNFYKKFPQSEADLYTERLNRLYGIREIFLHIEEVTGEDKTVDVVVEIFNQVNSGGTKLSKGDLALAKICAEWPDARDEMRILLRKWEKTGFYFKLEWLLRCVNTILTGEALFSALDKVSTAQFQDSLRRAERVIDALLNMISARLGLDHDRVLGSRYSFPVMARYLSQRGGHLADQKERDKLLYWYIHTIMWGRYAGSTETKINQDLHLIEETDDGLDRLIGQLRQERGDLTIRASDFWGWSTGARFYPLLYLLTRVWHARDWGSGIELSSLLLGKLSSLQLHHIFPKDLLYQHGLTRPDVNAIANFTFLTQETNLAISNRPPAEYLPEVARKYPGALESHWLPMDPTLWRVENYPAFLEARRELLAQAANAFLASLLAGEVPEATVAMPIMERGTRPIPGGIGIEGEEQLLIETNAWVIEQGLPEGEMAYELLDFETEQPLAILDLAWPDGLQEGYSEPAALLLNEEKETIERASQAGFRCFTDVETFRQYVRREILALESNAA